MNRPFRFHLIMPGALALGLALFALGHPPLAFGEPESASRARVTRDAANPAWGHPRWTLRYAFDGKCDDPRYIHTTGLSEAGGDEEDCRRFGGGLKG